MFNLNSASLRKPLFAALLAVAASNAAAETGSEFATLNSADLVKGAEARLPEFLGCIRDNHASVIIAHRGGARAEYPENSLETFKSTSSQIPSILEVDVNQSKDGVLFLFHDDTLDRASMGKGPIAEKTWEEISEVRLVDTIGLPTRFKPVKLDEVLEWADTNALLMLDLKPQINLEDAIAAIKAADAEERVILLPYTIERAQTLRKALPRTMMVVPSTTEESFLASKAAGLIDRHALVSMPTHYLAPDYRSIFSGVFGKVPEKEELLDTVQSSQAITVSMIYGGPETSDARYSPVTGEKVYSHWGKAGLQLMATNRALEAGAELTADSDYTSILTECLKGE